ncbi:MAG: type II toxin-antitoxin system mRNA interferase toxin, RelE/StbE family [Acidobacteria bacterium]|nr:MAG: type II toxin-antitoxin system mRNA interferase toxin, RelE/StbE family [Acidobacteriota bacterium]
MARYKLLIKVSAAKEIEGIPKRDRQRVINRITKLADDPRCAGCEKLSGQERYRVRQGRYRILYTINDEEVIVVVVKVAHRREVYR